MQRFLVPSGALRLAFCLAFAVPSFAALPSATVWEVRPTVGSNTNGGGFVTGSAGTDWSQQNAAQYSLVNGVTNGTTTVATVSASADMVGNIAYIAGGTGGITGGWYQIVSESLGVSITVDRAAGLTTGTGVTINIGGALSTIAQANTNATTSNVIWIKATGTTTVTSAITISLNSNPAPNSPLSFIGYTTTRGDNGQITWTTATNSIDIVDFTAANNVLFENIIFSSTAGTPGHGLMGLSSADTVGVFVINCKFSGFLNAIDGNFNVDWAFANLYIMNTRITASTSFGLVNSGSTFIFGSMFDNNTLDGANWSSGNVTQPPQWFVSRSVFYKNGGNGLQMTSLPSVASLVIDSSCFSTNTGAGLLTTNTLQAGAQVTNSIFDANSTYGVDAGSGSSTPKFLFFNNAFFNNTTAPSRAVTGQVGTITLSGSPYVSVGTNFALNSTAGAGAALKGTGVPGTIPAAGTGFASVGCLDPSTGATASQHGYPIVQ